VRRITHVERKRHEELTTLKKGKNQKE